MHARSRSLSGLLLRHEKRTALRGKAYLQAEPKTANKLGSHRGRGEVKAEQADFDQILGP